MQPVLSGPRRLLMPIIVHYYCCLRNSTHLCDDVTVLLQRSDPDALICPSRETVGSFTTRTATTCCELTPRAITASGLPTRLPVSPKRRRLRPLPAFRCTSSDTSGKSRVPDTSGPRLFPTAVVRIFDVVRFYVISEMAILHDPTRPRSTVESSRVGRCEYTIHDPIQFISADEYCEQ